MAARKRVPPFTITDVNGGRWNIEPHLHAATREHTGWVIEAPAAPHERRGHRSKGSVTTTVLLDELVRQRVLVAKALWSLPDEQALRDLPGHDWESHIRAALDLLSQVDGASDDG